MTLPLEEIEAKAKAATPGPWTATNYDIMNDGNAVAGCCWVSGRDFNPYANAEFIALMNPQTALALVARVRELEAFARRIRDHPDEATGRWREWAQARAKQVLGGLP